jgi:hypothetical protein
LFKENHIHFHQAGRVRAFQNFTQYAKAGFSVLVLAAVAKQPLQINVGASFASCHGNLLRLPRTLASFLPRPEAAATSKGENEKPLPRTLRSL